MKAQLAPSHGLCRPYFCVQNTVLVPYEEAKTVSLNISFSTKIFITKFEIRETVLACSYGAQPSSFWTQKGIENIVTFSLQSKLYTVVVYQWWCSNA